jgi:alkylhydroperoxidase family enzyme
VAAVAREGRPSRPELAPGRGPGRFELGLAEVERRIGAAGWDFPERRVIALAVFATLAGPVDAEQAEVIAGATAEIGDPDLALDMTGVVFTFNTANRVADARRVELEYRRLRDLPAVRDWVERRFAELVGLVYDLAYVHVCRDDPDEVLGAVDALARERGGPGSPPLFERLRPAPAVLSGVVAMLRVNARDSGVARDLWTRGVAVATAARTPAGSPLRRMIDAWLAGASLPDTGSLLALARSAVTPADLPVAALRYAWQVGQAPYTVTDEDIRRLGAFGLSDAEVLDLCLGASLFAALATIEPLAGAVRLAPSAPDGPWPGRS